MIVEEKRKTKLRYKKMSLVIILGFCVVLSALPEFSTATPYAYEAKIDKNLWLEEGKTYEVNVRVDWNPDLEQIKFKRKAVVSQLKREATKTQEPIITFLEQKGAKVLNTFWITNVIFIEAYANNAEDSATLQYFELSGIIARYVKFYCSDNHGNRFYIRVNEFELYGYVYQNDAGSGGDAGNNFDRAISISPGNYTGYADESFDPYDWYKFNVTPGKFIEVTMISPTGCNYDLYLYDPFEHVKNYSVAAEDTCEHI